jgi:hypothetical protein
LPLFEIFYKVSKKRYFEQKRGAAVGIMLLFTIKIVQNVRIYNEVMTIIVIFAV